MPEPLLLLADQRSVQIVVWSAALILLVLALGGVIVLLRRRFIDEPEADDGPVLALSDLRRLRSEGKLSDAEYDRAVEQMRRAMSGDSSGEPIGGVPGGGVSRRSAGRAPAGGSDEIVAPPGFDLTGEPLPDQKEAE